jgi:hypothetical protein
MLLRMLLLSHVSTLLLPHLLPALCRAGPIAPHKKTCILLSSWCLLLRSMVLLLSLQVLVLRLALLLSVLPPLRRTGSVTHKEPTILRSTALLAAPEHVATHGAGRVHCGRRAWVASRVEPSLPIALALQPPHRSQSMVCCTPARPGRAHGRPPPTPPPPARCPAVSLAGPPSPARTSVTAHATARRHRRRRRRRRRRRPLPRPRRRPPPCASWR